MTEMTTRTDAFEDVIASWDEQMTCQLIDGCPNTATWLAVHHCTPNTGADRIVVCDWHMKRWLRGKRG